jgi:excisionase family DNA binding protein
MSETRIVNLDQHDEPFVTVRQLAEYWHVSTRTIERHVAKGALPVTRVGPFSRPRIAIADARAYGRPENGDTA